MKKRKVLGNRNRDDQDAEMSNAERPMGEEKVCLKDAGR